MKRVNSVSENNKNLVTSGGVYSALDFETVNVTATSTAGTISNLGVKRSSRRYCIILQFTSSETVAKGSSIQVQFSSAILPIYTKIVSSVYLANSFEIFNSTTSILTIRPMLEDLQPNQIITICFDFDRVLFS